MKVLVGTEKIEKEITNENLKRIIVYTKPKSGFAGTICFGNTIHFATKSEVDAACKMATNVVVEHYNPHIYSGTY